MWVLLKIFLIHVKGMQNVGQFLTHYSPTVSRIQQIGILLSKLVNNPMCSKNTQLTESKKQHTSGLE